MGEKAEKERCEVLMKQVPGSPSPLSAGIIGRLPARFSSAEPRRWPLDVWWVIGGAANLCLFFPIASCFNKANHCGVLTVVFE